MTPCINCGQYPATHGAWCDNCGPKPSAPGPGSLDAPRCGICGCEMDKDEDCGGDCVYCMASAGDPDCINRCIQMARGFRHATTSSPSLLIQENTERSDAKHSMPRRVPPDFMNYYIATKLENHAEHNRLRDALNARGHNCTYDWSVHGPVYTLGLGAVREVAQLEMRGVLDADAVIVLWPGGRGTHVELGAAIALRKNIVLVSDVDGHHIASPDTCAFYHHPSVTRVRTLEDAFEVLTSHRWNTELSDAQRSDQRKVQKS